MVENLTAHFNPDEFHQPALYGLPRMPYPVEWIPARLLPLCKDILEPIREACGGRKITIIPGGGYRSPEWNERHHEEHPGAVLASQHCNGIAADIVVDGMAPSDVHGIVLELHRAGMIKLGGLGLYAGFVHVDVRGGDHLAQWTG